MSTNSNKRDLRSIGLDQDTADKVRLFANGSHYSLQPLLRELLPLMREYLDTKRGNYVPLKSYLRLPNDPVIDFVEETVASIINRAQMASSFVAYILIVGSPRLQQSLFKTPKPKNGNKTSWLQSQLLLTRECHGDIMTAVEYMLDLFHLDHQGQVRLKTDKQLANQHLSGQDFAKRLENLLESIYLRFLLPQHEATDVIFQHLYIVSDPARINAITGMDPMTEGILIHFYLLRKLCHEKAWRTISPLPSYNEEAILRRYQQAKDIMDKYASLEYPSVYRVLSEWT